MPVRHRGLAFAKAVISFVVLASSWSIVMAESCVESGVVGECTGVSTCEHKSFPGKCAGPAAIQCCAAYYGTCTRADGAQGSCQPTDSSCSAVVSGLCPGDSSIKCCIRGGSGGSSSAATGADDDDSSSSSIAGRLINDAGLAMLAHFEGAESDFYLDAVGIATIGYGHACHSFDCTKLQLLSASGRTSTIAATKIARAPGYLLARGSALTEQEMRNLLRADLHQVYVPCVVKALAAHARPGHVTDDDQFAALTSLAYNIGCGALQKSTVLARALAGAPLEGATGMRAAFTMWKRAGSACLNGLVRRRNAEADLYGGLCGSSDGQPCHGCGSCVDVLCAGRTSGGGSGDGSSGSPAKCSVDGAGSGLCVDRSGCDGAAHAGRCPGSGANIQCCVVDGAAASALPCFVAGVGSGKCLDVAACDAAVGATRYAGHCPGASSIQCCVKGAASSGTAADGTSVTLAVEKSALTSDSAEDEGGDGDGDGDGEVQANDAGVIAWFKQWLFKLLEVGESAVSGVRVNPEGSVEIQFVDAKVAARFSELVSSESAVSAASEAGIVAVQADGGDVVNVGRGKSSGGGGGDDDRDDGDGDKGSSGAVIGGVVGGIVAVAVVLVVGAVIMVRRKRVQSPPLTSQADLLNSADENL